MEEKGLENSAEGEVNAESGKEESDDEKFFDAVEDESASFDKSVTFEPPMEAVGNGGEKEEEGDSEVKFSHKRNLSVVSMNDAQLLTSSPEPDQLPVCLERTMSVRLRGHFFKKKLYSLPPSLSPSRSCLVDLCQASLRNGSPQLPRDGPPFLQSHPTDSTSGLS